MVRVLINAPRFVKKDQPFDVKLLISHPMESGQRRDAMGQAVPRDIINSLTVTFGDGLVIRADLFPAIAANPFLAFSIRAPASGTLAIRFTDDHGTVQTEQVAIDVE